MKRLLICGLLICMLLVMGCSAKETSLLDPDKPISITVWHYYNGHIKDKFDLLVQTFNETVGMEQGIVVDAQSQGDVEQLAQAVYESATQSIGALPMPDLFAAYPDNAYRVNEIVPLVSIDTYFSNDELGAFREEFLEEGRFLSNQERFIVPIAKSTENLYVNKTDWDAFASVYGYTEADLRTWEGLFAVAQTYYEATGKGFFGLDANANFFLQAGMQLGSELFDYQDGGNVTLVFPKDVAYRIWQYYYVPYLRGYYVKTGRFSSDDARTGTVIAYTGSTAGAAYFPKNVTVSHNHIYDIEPLILPYPVFEGGLPYAVQQGAGMSIVKSEPSREYAASVFLKWFVAKEQNITFAVSTGYFPVMTEALNEVLLLDALSALGIKDSAIEASIRSTSYMFEHYTLYNNKPFYGSYDMRVLLESHLFNKIKRDLERIEATEGQEQALIQELISEDAFMKWYEQFIEEAQAILN